METVETQTDPVQLPVFVYGNERPGAIAHSLIREFIAEGGIRPATLQGCRMYNFRDFPGIIESTPDVPPVVGELLIFKPENYLEAVKRIDRYEGGGFAFYRVDRLYADIWPKEDNGLLWQDRRKNSIRAWVYLLNHKVIEVDPNRAIKSNDWMNRD